MLLIGSASSGDEDPGSAALRASLLGSLLGVSAPASSESPNAVSALFVLGDSLSDIGNAAGFTDYLLGQTIAPPAVGLCNPADVVWSTRDCGDLFYGRGRVTDGEVAVEHLAKHLGVATFGPSLHVIPSGPNGGTNYAVASAKASAPGIEDLSHQVDRLLLDHAPLPADAVYVVMIGGNDAIDALQATATSPEASAAVVAAATAAIIANAERLLDFGARRLVIANVPDLSSLPAVRSYALASPDPATLLARASAIAEDFDRELRAFAARAAADPRWSAPTAPSVVLFDLRAALQGAQLKIAAAGGNALDACFDSATYRLSSDALRLFHSDCAPDEAGAARFDRFVFWDGIHPTGAVHAIIGAALAGAVDAAQPGP